MKYLLHSAVKDNKLGEICSLLEIGLDINEGDEEGLTPLHIAVNKSNNDLFHFLLKRGASVDLKCNGLTALHVACMRGLLEIVRLCVENGASLNALAPGGISPIAFAILEGYIHIVNFLFDQGVEIDNEDGCSKTPLFYAVICGNLEMIEAVLSRSPSVESKGNKESFKAVIKEYHPHGQLIFQRLLSYGFTFCSDIVEDGELLLAAITNGYDKIVYELLKKGSNPNYISKSRKNHNCFPLFTSLKVNKLNIAKLLVNSGANINIKDHCGRSLLYSAIDMKNLMFLSFILKNGADISVCDKRGLTPVLYAVKRHGFGKCLKLFLDYGPNIDAKAKDGRTLLHFAVQSGEPENVKLVLKYCPSLHMIEYRDLFYDLTVCTSSRSDELVLHNDIINTLLDYGFIPNDKHVKNSTILREAVHKGFYRLVENLLARGADPNLLVVHKPPMNGPSQYYSMPIFRYACQSGRTDIARLLMVNGADLNIEGCENSFSDAVFFQDLHLLKMLLATEIPRRMEYLFFQAVYISSRKMTEYILEYEQPCINVNSTFIGETLIHVTARNSDPSVLMLLWEYGAEINPRKLSDWGTPLHTALHTGSDATIKALLDLRADMDAVNINGFTPIDMLNEYRYEDTPVIREHIASLYYAGMYVSSKCLSYISGFQMEYMRAECEKEVEAMKKTHFGNSSLSFYDILICSTYQVAVFAKNPSIIETLKSTNYEILFPRYQGLLTKNIERGLKKRFLIDQATKTLYSIKIFNSLPWHSVENILSFLTIEELMIMNRLCRPREEFHFFNNRNSSFETTHSEHLYTYFEMEQYRW